MKKIDILYYIAIFGVFIIKLVEISEIIKIDASFQTVINMVLVILLMIKIIFTKYSKKQLILICILGLLNLYLTLVLNYNIFIINFLAMVGIKDIKIKNVVKIDIIVKLSFLLIHTILYFYDYIYNYENIFATLYTRGDEVRHTLYLGHPNPVGMIVVWLAIDMLYVSKNIKKTYIFTTLFVIFYYYFSVSRTAFIIYIIFSVLLFLNNIKQEWFNEKTNFLLKYLIDIFAVLTIILVVLFTVINNNNIINFIDNILSGRLYYSKWALDTYGFNLLPNAETVVLEENLIVDNFYIRCMISYGFITYLALSVKYKLLSNNVKNIDRIILMILPLYLFNEIFCYNVGRTIALLILANALFNNKKEEKVSGY